MGVAGQRAEDRGLAHYKWAERYTKRGQIDKALAHFGRALDFGGRVLGDQPQDFESAFAYVQAAVRDARDARTGLICGRNLRIQHKNVKDKVLITMTEQMEAGWFLGSSEKTASAEVPAGRENLHQRLLGIGLALDKCAKDLGLHDDIRVFIQGTIMQNAFSSYIKRLLLAEAKYARRDKADAEATPPGESQGAQGTGTPASG